MTSTTPMSSTFAVSSIRPATTTTLSRHRSQTRLAQDIPGDRPVLAIGEGLTMYLTKEDGVALLRSIVDHFPSGELQFDAFNRLGIKSQWTNTVVRRSGATLHWGIDGPDDITEAVPGVRRLAWVSPIDDEAFANVPWYYRLTLKAIRPVPVLRYMAQYHRYVF
jgi:O-methyltransferase involved in polyketide biosynthesis